MKQELTTQTKSSTDLALPKQSKPLLAVINEDYPKIRSITSVEPFDSLINYLITILNIKTTSEQEKKDLNVQMLVVLDFIKTKFSSLTIEEVKEAFKMYVSKEFPEIKVFRMLDCVVVGEVLNAYVDFRNESLRVYDNKKKQLPLNASLTNSEINEIMVNSINQRYEEFKLTKEINPPYLAVFKELVERDKIKIPNSQTPLLHSYYLKKMEEAKEIVSNELKTDIYNATTPYKRNELKTILNTILSNGYCEDANVKVESVAKKLVLIDYFNNCLKKGIDKIF
jgi:hypothetical protein